LKELYILWGVIVGFMMLSANTKGTYLFGSLSEGGGGSSSSRGYSRGWGGWSSGGGGGGYHK
jgi:hypothetical protein